MTKENKNRVLFVSAQLPSGRVPIAGQKVAWQHLKLLKGISEIHLVTFVNELEISYMDVNDYEFCYYSKVITQTKKRRIFNQIKRIFHPFKVTSRFSKKNLNLLITIIDKYQIKHAHFEFTSSLLLAYRLKKARPQLKLTFVSHDVTFQAYFRLKNTSNIVKKIFYSIEYYKMKYFEIKALSVIDNNIVLNEKDKEILLNENILNTKVQFPIVEDWILSIKRNKIHKQTILFLGALHRHENLDALNWFITEIFPLVLKKYPLTILNVVGKIDESAKISANNPNINYLGYVKNLVDVFEKTQISIVPLRFGAGIKIKTLETISARIPTISTEIGAEGIPKTKYLKIAETETEFSKLIFQEFEL